MPVIVLQIQEIVLLDVAVNHNIRKNNTEVVLCGISHKTTSQF